MFFIEYFTWFLSRFEFIFVVTVVSLLLKSCILFFLLRSIRFSNKIGKPFIFLLIILVSNMFSDIAWVLNLLYELIAYPKYQIVSFFTHIAWVFFVVQYQSLILFVENLIIQKYYFSKRQIFFCLISSIFCMLFLFIATVSFKNIDISQYYLLRSKTETLSTFYVMFVLAIPSVLLVLQKMRTTELPLILKQQLFIFIGGFILPLLTADFIQLNPFQFRVLGELAHNYIAVSFTTIFLTIAIYFCARKIFGLRFLNLKSHVQRPMNMNFIEDFKGVLERLSAVTTCEELIHITQHFFKETFDIPITKTQLYFRKTDSQITDKVIGIKDETVVSLVETFLLTHSQALDSTIKDEKVLIFDEIDFSHFYHACESGEIMLRFLRTINADIFLPIYEKNKLIAYIIVERHARTGNFYSNVERDELMVFSSYLGNIINLLQSKQLDILLEQEQYLRQELYHKHQEISQYKESIRTFLRKGKSQQIGIIFYKNRRFVVGNEAAKEFIDINVNVHQGHPLTQTLKKLVQNVESFKTPQSVLAKHHTDGSTIVLSAVPHLEQNTIIITVSYPDVSDTIKHFIDLLKDPTECDYLLYLQTTESGRLINKLIPGVGAALLQFKIELLKASLSKRALLLDMQEQDIKNTVELVHHISFREVLHTLSLQGPSKNADVAIALFGVNPLFGLPDKYDKPLLATLDGVGTLFIKNVHHLDIETQEHLAAYIRYGYYSPCKSDKKMVSDVRIICSSNQHLLSLTQAGKFSKNLLQELKGTTLSMPSLMTLPDHELQALAAGYTEQALVSDAFQHVLELTDREKNVLVKDRPVSLQDLKNRVQQFLVKKSKKNLIYDEVEFNPTYDLSDPDLIAAARLGKQALKDRRVMTLLWNKFKSQNKISTFLGVNRSSINRRCKEYNLI